MFVCTAGHTRSFELPDYASAAVPTSSSETLVLALGVGVATLALESAEVTPVALTDSDPGRVRVNDAKVDPAGRLWLGTTAVDEAPGMGALYRLDGDGSMEKVLDGLSVSNGPAWSLDGDAMFHVDSPARSIRRFDFDPADGSLGQGRELVDTSPWSGLPDGMTIDADGNLWVAFWDGGCVRCFSADDGSLLAAVDLPVARPTSCAFGRTGLDRLLVTSATYELSAAQLRDQPLAGSVLSVDVGVSGRAAVPARLPPGPTRGS